ncbi:MAG: tetratricopeptide repeat protein [Phycisphaerae bacterium]
MESKENATSTGSRTMAGIVVVLVLLGAIGLVVYVMQPSATPQVPTGQPDAPTGREVISTARFQVKTGRVAQAMGLLSKYIATNPADREARLYLAELYMLRDQDDRAQVIVDAVLAEDPNWPAALWLKGGLVEPKDPARAEAWYRMAADQPNAGPEIWSAFGRALLGRKQIDDALGYLAKAYAAGARQEEVVVPLAAARMQAKQYDRAAALLAEARTHTPQSARAWVLSAMVAKQQNRLEQAEACFRQALQTPIDPGQAASVWMEIGQLAWLDHRWIESAEAFAEASTYRPLRGQGAFEAARAYFRADQYALAMEQIDRAWQDLSDDPEVQRLRKQIEDARFGPPEDDVTEDWFGRSEPSRPGSRPGGGENGGPDFFNP